MAQPTFTGVGTGMTEMLDTALTQTGCFDVQERAEMEEINKELALIGKKVEAEAADFMITGSITSLGFEQSSTGLGGLSFLKGPLSMLAGAVDYKKSKVHMNGRGGARPAGQIDIVPDRDIAAKNINERVAARPSRLTIAQVITQWNYNAGLDFFRRHTR